MLRRSFMNLTGLAIAATMGLATLGNTAALASDQNYFFDILYLAEGKTVDDAKAYFTKIEPVVAKHGLVRLSESFQITQKMRGDIDPNLVNLWTVSDPKATMPGIFKDPAYQQHIEQRNATFDMERSLMFMMKDY